MVQKSFKYIALFALLIIVGCKSDQNDQLYGKPIKQTSYSDTINFIGHWLNEGDRELFVRNMARSYEFENQDINVNLVFPEDIYYDPSVRGGDLTFITQLIKNRDTKWDIIRINGIYSGISKLLGDDEWGKKYLVDFSEIPEFCENTLPNLLSSKEKEKWNGIIPGPYMEGNYWALWVNLDVAKKIGIEVKQYGMQFEDFKGYLEKLHRYNQEHPEDYIGPILDTYQWRTSQGLAISLYTSLLDSPELFYTKKINSQRLNAWNKTLDALETIATYKPMYNKWRETGWEDLPGLILEDKCLFYVSGSWMYNIWKKMDEKKVLKCMPAELPVFKKQVVYPSTYIVTWAVPKFAPHRDQAVKFLLSINQPDKGDMWCRYTKSPTGIKTSLASEALGGDMYEEFSQHIQKTYGENIYSFEESSSWILDDMHSNTPTFYYEVIEGGMTASDAMNKIRSSIP